MRRGAASRVGRHPRHRHPIGPGPSLFGDRQREHRPHRVGSAPRTTTVPRSITPQRGVELVRGARRARRDAVEHPARPVDADEQRRRVARAGVQLAAPLAGERPHRRAALAQRLVDLGGQVRPQPPRCGARPARSPTAGPRAASRARPAAPGRPRARPTPRRPGAPAPARRRSRPARPRRARVEVALVEGRTWPAVAVVAGRRGPHAGHALQRERTDGPRRARRRVPPHRR